MSVKRTWEVQVQAVRPYCAMFTVEANTEAEAKVRAEHILESCDGDDLGLEWEPFDESPDMLRAATITSVSLDPDFNGEGVQ